jgi:Arc/MetJ family transcription regulator
MRKQANKAPGSPVVCGIRSKTTLLIDDGLLNNAQVLTGLTNKTAVVQAALEALVANESARRLQGGVGVVKVVRHRRTRLPG